MSIRLTHKNNEIYKFWKERDKYLQDDWDRQAWGTDLGL